MPHFPQTCLEGADKGSMSTSAIGNFSSSSYLQQVLASALQSAGITANSTSNATTTAASSSQSDSSQLSPFAQLANSLQQLQESDPTKYKQVTQQVATNLQSAAQSAQSQGNSGAAGQLTQLAADFTSASQSGQLPNLGDLAQAVGGSSGGGHHHRHHAGAASSDSTAASSTSTPSSSSTSSTSTTLSQLLASLEQTSGSLLRVIKARR
jgi:hypothetical protein